MQAVRTTAAARSSLRSPSNNEHGWGAIANIIAQRFLRGERGIPKHVQLRLALKQLIESGELRPGCQLPPEQQLSQATGISPGTVQKALTQMAADGWLIRAQGRGTFVAEPTRPFTETWHFRFVDPSTGQLLPVYSELIERKHLKRVDEQAGFVTALGHDPSGYIEIVRLIDVGHKFKCHSRMQLGATRFSALMELPAAEFRNINLKLIFAEQFAAPTLSVTQTAIITPVSPEVKELLKVTSRTRCMRLEIVAYTHGRAPLSCQQIIIPPSEYPLDLTPVSAEQPPRR